MSIVDHGARTHPPPCALCSPVGRPTRFQLLIWFLTPPCSYVSSSVHSHLAAAKIQTPREGGGFGIFPTVDERQVRFVRYVLITPEDKARVRPPEHLHTCSSAVRAGWRRTGGPPATQVVNEHSRWKRAVIRLLRTRLSGLGVEGSNFRFPKGRRLPSLESWACQERGGSVRWAFDHAFRNCRLRTSKLRPIDAARAASRS